MESSPSNAEQIFKAEVLACLATPKLSIRTLSDLTGGGLKYLPPAQAMRGLLEDGVAINPTARAQRQDAVFPVLGRAYHDFLHDSTAVKYLAGHIGSFFILKR